MDTERLDDKLDRLHEARPRWARLDVAAKADLVDGLMDRLARAARPIVERSL